MPILILLATVLALILWRLWARDRVENEMGRRLDPLFYRLFRRRKCRWHHIGHRASLGEFRCQTCGVTAYSNSSAGPTECKRGLSGGNL